MSNLLDRASIVLTPTAYNNGEALCVKPDDASGDFQFSRNSAATRVNSQGLVEDVQILSSNLVQNGNFSQIGSEEVTNGNFSQQGSQQVVDGSFANGDADWNRENSVFTISGGVANGNGANGGSEELSQNFSQDLTAGKTYKIVFELLNYVSGSVQFALTGGGSLFGTSQSADGTFTQYVVALGNNNKIKFRGANFNGSITSISLVEVGQDWVLGTGWSIGDSVASCDGTQTGGTSLYQSALQQNKSYKITFSITSITAGGVGVVNSPKYTTTGTFTYYYNVTGTDSNLYVNANTDFNGSITNISVKEVGQNWSLGTGWNIGTNKAITDGSQTGVSGWLRQNNRLTVGKKYKFSCYIDTIDIGRVGDAVDGSSIIIKFENGGGEYTTTFTATDTTLAIAQRTGKSASITNIKIIEISDDTNLPRISYENFSYQDVLGSELVTGGDFSSPSDWNLFSATIEDGKLTLNSVGGGGAYASQTGLNIVANTTYLITFGATRISGDTNLAFTFGAGNNVSGSPIITTSGAKSYYFTPTVNFNNFGLKRNFGGSGAVWEVENFSIKEYKGQEVVPDSGCGSWLWENQSTNLIPYSELFSNSAWGKTSISVLSNVIASPSGEINASKIVESNTSGFHFISDNISVLSGANTFTFYSKAAERTQVSAFFSQSGNVGALFDLTAETATASGTGNTASIESVGNGWYRCVVSNNGSSQISNQVRIGTNNGALGGYQGDGTSGLFIWGAQVEQQTYSTSYIPTSGQASGVTRNQDVCNNGGSAASINSAEGVFYAEIAALANDGTFRQIAISDGSTSNVVRFYYSQTANRIVGNIKSSGSSVFFFNNFLTNATDFIKIAISYKVNDFKMYVNGVKVHTDTSGNTPTGLNEVAFDNGGGNDKFFGKTKAVAVWKEPLSEEELAELTTI